MAVNKVLLVGLTKIRYVPKASFRDHDPDRVMCFVFDNKDSLSDLCSRINRITFLNDYAFFLGYTTYEITMIH